MYSILVMSVQVNNKLNGKYSNSTVVCIILVKANPRVLHVDELLENVGGELAHRQKAGSGAHEPQCLARRVGVRRRDGRVAGRTADEHFAHLLRHVLRDERLQRAAVARLNQAADGAELYLHLQVVCEKAVPYCTSTCTLLYT